MKTNKALLYAIVAAICGASVPVLAKYALQILQPFTLVSIRFLVASLTLLPFVWKDLNFRTFKNLLLPAFIGAFNPIILFIALQYTKASVSPLIYASVPAMTAIYLVIAKKKQISFSQKMGILVGFIGVVLIILFPALSAGQTSIVEVIKGNFLIFIAAIAFLSYGLISKQRQEDTNATPTALTFYFSAVTFVLSLPFALREIPRINLQDINILYILAAVGVGIVGTSLFYFAYQKALQIGSELSASLFTYLQPVFTVIFAILILGEGITPIMIVGGAMAIIGSQLATENM